MCDKMQRWQWILIVFGAATVIGGIAYLSIYLYNMHHLTGLLVNKGVPVKTSAYKVGDTLILSYQGKNLTKGGVDWSYSVDGGGNFNSIQAKVTSETQSWTIPGTVFSNKVVLRVADSTKTTLHVDSVLVSVSPVFRFNEGQQAVSSFLIPNTVPLAFQCNSTLVTQDNLVLQTSIDKSTWDPVSSVDTYMVMMSESLVNWQIGNDMAGSQRYLRLITNNLVAQNYPSELFADTPNSITFTANRDSGSKLSGGLFTALNVYGDAGATHMVYANTSYVLKGQTLYFQWAQPDGSVPFSLGDVTFQYQILTGGAVFSNVWRAMKPVVPAGDGTIYSWTIPADAGQDIATISFRVVLSNTNEVPAPSVSLLGLNLSTYYFNDPPSPTYDSTGLIGFQVTFESSEFMDSVLSTTGWTVNGFDANNVALTAPLANVLLGTPSFTVGQVIFNLNQPGLALETENWAFMQFSHKQGFMSDKFDIRRPQN